MQSGAAATLRVRATDGSGSPLAGASVLFTSPERGPSGVFPDSAATGQSYLRATTDSSGVAQAQFVAGFQAGPVPVEARIEGSDSATGFAVTILAQPASPSADPASVRRAVADALLATPENESVRLHGPFWLPAGSRLLPAERWSVSNRQVPIVLAADSWVLWIDDDVPARFAHEVRYVVADAGLSATEAVENAKVSIANWWPEAYQPFSIDPISLYSPTSANEQLAADLQVSAVPLTLEGVSEAPSDACAVLVYGPDILAGKRDTEAFRDHLIRTEKVAPGNIFMNEQNFGGATLNRTATEADLKRLIDQAAASGCNKLFLMISSHGSSGMGAGVSLRDPDRGGGKTLPYSELIGLLAPFRGKQLCALTDACFSGQFVLWLEGQGFSGEAISSADIDHSSYETRLGSKFFLEWIAALENSDADVDGGGVSFSEAHRFVVANTTDASVSGPMPLGGAINPEGTRRMELSKLDIRNEGDTRILNVMRPPGTDVSQPFVMDLSALGPSIATFPSQIVIPPFTSAFPVPVTGVECGEMQYQASGSDGVSSYIGRSTIQVGDFKVDPDPIIIPAAGQSVTVTVTRFGFWAGLMNNASELTVTPRRPSIATGPADKVPVPNGQLTTTFVVTGVSPGETMLDIHDKNSFSRKSVKVIVLGAPPPPPTGCPLSGESQVSTSVVSGTQHIQFTGNPSTATLTFESVNGVLTIQSNRNQFPPATGTLNLSDCTFNAQGVAQGPVAGFSNVQGDYSGQINSSDFSQLNVRIRIGIGGEFPDQQPVVWNAQGPFVADGQPPTSGGDVFLPPQQTISWAGGHGSVVFNPGSPGGWSATTPNDWITLDPPFFGSGPGAVNFHVAPNDSSSPRQGNIQFGSDSFPVIQDGTSSQRPVLFPGGVLNGMTFKTGTGPATWTTLAGSFPVQATRIWDSSDFNGAMLPTSLDGFQVTADGLPMGFYFISANQLNLLNNDTGHLGLNAFQVTGPGGVSDPIYAYRREYEPELFRFNPQGGRYIAAVHANGDLAAPPDLFETFPTSGLQPEETFLFFGSGFGQTIPPTSAAELIPQPAPLADQPVFLIGGLPARVRFAGRVSSGFDQFNVDAPPGLPPGDHLIEGFVNGRPLQTDAFVNIAGPPSVP